MFEPADLPRLFGLPPGADFPAEVVRGLLTRLGGGSAPEALGRVEIFVNSGRMQRRLAAAFRDGAPRLPPRIRLVTALGAETPVPGLPAAVPPLARRLELSTLIAGLLERQPDLAPRAALFDLADSLATLMDEMQGEGVSPDTLQDLDVSDQSGHWTRSLAFLDIVRRYFSAEAAPDPEARQRRAVEHLIARWEVAPPPHPVIVAGSTGSRGATALFMRAVARLPLGAVILPGFDFDMPARLWDRLDDPMLSEDHPQYRFARICAELDMPPPEVVRWTDVAPVPERNRTISLALRPAPVTDQWLTEGRELSDLRSATRDMSLVEAASPRQEALAIALILRDAAETGRTAALVTPDRNLTRRVTAALDRWGLEPDDSGGRPLALSAPGRFLRHVAALFGTRITAEALLTVLKHPLCHSGSDRGPHLRLTRELELDIRRKGPAFPAPTDLRAWAAKRDDKALRWAEWIAKALFDNDAGPRLLASHLERHIATAERLAAGPDDSGAGELWQKKPGEAAAAVIASLQREAAAGGTLSPRDYGALFDGLLQGEQVRDPYRPHPGIMIWGTLEARVQGADLVILGGLNDGTWPALPAPDPWLNRKMRKEAGLLLPERQVGLSAHDFQQAVAATEVVLTRAARDAEAETVVSRWLNRLTNLLDGLPEQGGRDALCDMRARGRHWLAMAEADEARRPELTPAHRPAPRPPVEARPKELSVTRIETLIRDPYAIYARHILGLKPLDPLRRQADAPLRGTIVHSVFERFIKADLDPGDPVTRAALMRIAAEVLERDVPWPTARRLWLARLDRVADWFLEGEIGRRAEGTPLRVEQRGHWQVPGTGFALTGAADRIDRLHDGRLAIYDYKTGRPPSPHQVRHFDKQLLLEALMAEAGAFGGIPAAEVAKVAHIGLGTKPQLREVPLRDPDHPDSADPAVIAAEFRDLIEAYLTRKTPYSSRRAVETRAFGGDYDQLARHGEWMDSDRARPEDVG